MRPKLLTFLISISLILSSGFPVQAQFFSKNPTKKELTEEISKLNKRIDSLLYEIGLYSIPIIDTLSNPTDTINPGGLNFFNNEDFIDPARSNTDSLLNIWYVQRAISIADSTMIDLEDEILTSSTPDSIYISRLKAINSYIPLPYNSIVKNHIIHYTQKIPNKIDIILGLSSYYLPQFEEIFDQYDLPRELVIMAIIESALNPRAVSRANAKGMWQFMHQTARQYGLKIDSYLDERLDPYTSAHAAARYLQDSYAIFGDWLLAIASYNCGAGNVNKAIRRAGDSKDFWAVYPHLPRETRGYVPSFVAALYSLHYYKEHKITPRYMAMPAHVDTFIISKPLHFGQISELLGISKEEISDNNPQYIRQIIPGNGNILRLPFQYTLSFVDVEKDIYAYKDSIFFSPSVYRETRTSSSGSSNAVTHTVKSGETLGHIALRYRVRVADLQAWNNIRGTNIRIGQRITIYTSNPPAAAAASTSSSTQSTASSSAAPATSTAGGYITYTVKKGDTLWDISRMFNGVSLDDIMKLNGFTSQSKIMPGAKIKIKPAS